MTSIGPMGPRNEPVRLAAVRLKPGEDPLTRGTSTVESRADKAGSSAIASIGAGVNPSGRTELGAAPVTAAGAHVTPSGTSREVRLVGSRVTPVGSSVTAAKVNSFVTGTSAAGYVRMHPMQQDQLDAGTKALQGVIDALFAVKDRVPTPGLDLAKPNPKFSIDFGRLVLCYTADDGSYKEVSLLEAMKDLSPGCKALNDAMEALAVQARSVVGSTQIQTQSLLQQCNRNVNKMDSLRNPNSEFHSRLPQSIADAKPAVSLRSPDSVARVNAAEQRLTAFKGALTAQIQDKKEQRDAKDREITAKRAEITALVSPIDPAVKATKEEELKELQKQFEELKQGLQSLQVLEKKVCDIDEFALTMALAYSPPPRATPEAIDQAARELRHATEGIYNQLYTEYCKEQEQPRFSWIFGLGAAPVGFQKMGPGIGREILTFLADGPGSMVGVRRVNPSRALDTQAQSGGQYAGDVGALLYNQMTDPSEQRLHYANYCEEIGIRLAKQHVTDDIFRALLAEESSPGSFVENLRGGITPEDARAIQAKMNPTPPAGPTTASSSQ